MRFLMVGELDGTESHISKMCELARALAKKQKKKAEIFFALRRPHALVPHLADLECKVLQAPYFDEAPLPAGKRKPLIVLYSDALRQNGYHNPLVLAGLIRSWRDLYALVKPDVLIAYSAPTALIAAQGFPCKKVVLGSGDEVPARADPMPPLRKISKLDPKILARRDGEVLGVINGALKILESKKSKSFVTLAEALATDADILTNFSEFDPYGDRAGLEGKAPSYMGPFVSLDSGHEVVWSKKTKKHILAYIHPQSGGFAQCLEALKKLPEDHEAVVFVPGVSKEFIQKHAKKNLRLFSEPVKLGLLLETCHLGISHASQGIACAFALYGVPQLMLPGSVEQLDFARALGRNTLGRGLIGRYGAAKVAELIKLLLSQGVYTDKATEFANKYKTFKPEKLADQIVEAILGVAAK